MTAAELLGAALEQSPGTGRSGRPVVPTWAVFQAIPEALQPLQWTSEFFLTDEGAAAQREGTCLMSPHWQVGVGLGPQVLSSTFPRRQSPLVMSH